MIDEIENHLPVKPNWLIEKITDILCVRTQNENREAFQLASLFFLAKVAGSLRLSAQTKDRGEIIANIYATILAPSGFGKGHSMYILENLLFKGFEDSFSQNVFPTHAQTNIQNLADNLHNLDPSTESEEYSTELWESYSSLGTHAQFTFPSSTVPALHQLREKLIYAGSGSINLQVDEIGSNLQGIMELLVVALELYDQGLTKTKLLKHTKENKRIRKLEGKTPTNVLLFGTPHALLDASVVEEMYFGLLQFGFGRRSLFAFPTLSDKAYDEPPEDVYSRLIKADNSKEIQEVKEFIASFADEKYIDHKIKLKDAEAIELTRYRLACEKKSLDYREGYDVLRTELQHRYFNVIKTATILALFDGNKEISKANLGSAIYYVEQSGRALTKITNRDKAYVKLAKYIANHPSDEITHPDLAEALPFYKTGLAARKDLMTMAIAWGYKHNIVIKNNKDRDIDFFSGEHVTRTSLDALTVSYSKHVAFNYEDRNVSLSQLGGFLGKEDYHWANHKFSVSTDPDKQQFGKNRSEATVISGANVLVFDIDDNDNMYTTHELLKNIPHLIQTTKSHTPEFHRFRLIVPVSHIINGTEEEYQQIYLNVLEWLPVNAEKACKYRSKKWETNPKSEFLIQEDGEILNILRFIPDTLDNNEHKKARQTITSMDKVDQWFITEINDNGERNNYLIRYAYLLAERTQDFEEIKSSIMALNSQLASPLTAEELKKTVLQSIKNRLK